MGITQHTRMVFKCDWPGCSTSGVSETGEAYDGAHGRFATCRVLMWNGDEYTGVFCVAQHVATARDALRAIGFVQTRGGGKNG